MKSNDFSPLLEGAIEDLAHALEHVERGSEKDRKYAVIHAATAVELVLKEKIRSMGISIFKKKRPYRSLDYYDCIRLLHDKQITIPHEADIELLHQERNACIHIGGKPDENKTKWLLNTSRDFMETFCNDQLGFDISRHLPLQVPVKILDEARGAHLNPAGIYLANAEMSLIDGNYAEAVLNAEASITILMKDYLETMNIKASPVFHQLVRQVEKEKKLPQSVLETIEELHNLRNKVAHLVVKVDKRRAERAIELTRVVFETLEELWIRENRCIVCGSPEVVGVEVSYKVDPRKIKSREDLDKLLDKRKGQVRGYYCKNHEPYWATH